MGTTVDIRLLTRADLKGFSDLKAAASKADSELKGMDFSVGKGLQVAGAITGVAASLESARDMVRAGIDMNKELQLSQIGLASIFQTFRTGNVDNFAQAMTLAAKAQKMLREESEKTGNFRGLLESYQSVAAEMSKANIPIEKQISLTRLLAQATAAAGLTGPQITQEARALVTGNIGPDAQLSRQLGITGPDVAQARNQGKLYDFLISKLQAFDSATDDVSKSFDTRMQRMKQSFEFFAAAVTKPAFDELSKGFDELGKSLDKQGGDEGVVKSLGRELQGLASALTGTAKFLIEHAGLIKDVTIAYGLFAAARFAAGKADQFATFAVGLQKEAEALRLAKAAYGAPQQVGGAFGALDEEAVMKEFNKSFPNDLKQAVKKGFVDGAGEALDSVSKSRAFRDSTATAAGSAGASVDLVGVEKRIIREEAQTAVLEAQRVASERAAEAAKLLSAAERELQLVREQANATMKRGSVTVKSFADLTPTNTGLSDKTASILSDAVTKAEQKVAAARAAAQVKPVVDPAIINTMNSKLAELNAKEAELVTARDLALKQAERAKLVYAEQTAALERMNRVNVAAAKAEAIFADNRSKKQYDLVGGRLVALPEATSAAEKFKGVTGGIVSGFSALGTAISTVGKVAAGFLGTLGMLVIVWQAAKAAADTLAEGAINRKNAVNSRVESSMTEGDSARAAFFDARDELSAEAARDNLKSYVKLTKQSLADGVKAGIFDESQQAALQTSIRLAERTIAIQWSERTKQISQAEIQAILAEGRTAKLRSYETSRQVTTDYLDAAIKGTEDAATKATLQVSKVFADFKKVDLGVDGARRFLDEWTALRKHYEDIRRQIDLAGANGLSETEVAKLNIEADATAKKFHEQADMAEKLSDALKDMRKGLDEGTTSAAQSAKAAHSFEQQVRQALTKLSLNADADLKIARERVEEARKNLSAPDADAVVASRKKLESVQAAPDSKAVSDARAFVALREKQLAEAQAPGGLPLQVGERIARLKESQDALAKAVARQEQERGIPSRKEDLDNELRKQQQERLLELANAQKDLIEIQKNLKDPFLGVIGGYKPGQFADQGTSTGLLSTVTLALAPLIDMDRYSYSGGGFSQAQLQEQASRATMEISKNIKRLVELAEKNPKSSTFAP